MTNINEEIEILLITLRKAVDKASETLSNEGKDMVAGDLEEAFEELEKALEIKIFGERLAAM